MSVVIAGGAGFIGSRLAARLAGRESRILIIDNLCRGKREYIKNLEENGNVEFLEADLSIPEKTLDSIAAWHEKYPVDMVWHMAANSDIPAGIADANVDLRDTFMTTFSLLEAMKKLSIQHIAFASSSAIYGEFKSDIPLHEDIGPLLPISNYGAMKLASEAAISAATASWLKRALIFRFPNVVGIPATHGVILDFVHKLAATPDNLEVLGDGSQQKAYLHVENLVDAMLFIAEKADGKSNIFNIGPEDQGCRVQQIAEIVVSAVSPGASIQYGHGDRGWVGDVPKFRYSTKKLADLGWQPPASSREAVARAVMEIAEQEGVICPRR